MTCGFCSASRPIRCRPVDDPGRALAEKRVGIADLSRTVLARYEGDALRSGPADEFDQGHLRGGLLPGGLAYYFDTDADGEPTLTLVPLGSRAGAQPRR